MLKAEYQDLLDQVQGIRKKEDEKHKNGDFFNIFNVVGKSSDEVNIHSKFLAMLLNPKGDHGCGGAFLESFCKELRIDTSSFDVDNAYVSPEYDIGPIRNNGLDGGRIDIIIKFDKEFAIIIENKIYAGDQNNQLLRYKNYAEEKFGSSGYKIFYLTPDGHEPDEKSTGKAVSGDYWTSISYEKEIKSWLKKWLETKSTKNEENYWIHPIIKQYIKLIDSITGNDVDDDVSSSIREILEKGENLACACKMRERILDVKKKIFEKFCEILEKSVKEDYGLKCKKEMGETRWLHFHIYKLNWSCRFTIELDIKSFDCKYGLTLKEKNENNASIKKELRKLQDYRNKDKYWMIWNYLPDEFANWNTETFVSVNNDAEKLLAILQDKIDAYIPALDGLVNKRG